MPVLFSERSLGEENFILFTGLKETSKPMRERILEILKENRRIKKQNCRIEIWVIMTDSVFNLLILFKALLMTEGF